MSAKKPKEIRANSDIPVSPSLRADLSSTACEPLVTPATKTRKIVGKKRVIAPLIQRKTPEIRADIFKMTKPAADDNKKTDQPVTDEKFLNTVRDMVYEKLIDGQMELKIDYGFKAIELRQRITDGSQNEKLLLEILNEIRKEELGKTQ
jgi:hypothetical protein